MQFSLQVYPRGDCPEHTYREVIMSSTSSESGEAKQLSQLKASRTAKKGIITRRIRQIETMVAEKAKKKVIAKMMEGLQVVFAELRQVCSDISNLTEDFDELNSTEVIRFNVETCLAEAAASLDDRQDEPPSSGSIASAWLNQNFDEKGAAKAGGNGFGTPEKEETVVDVAAAITHAAEMLRDDHVVNTSEDFHSVSGEESELRISRAKG